MRTATQQDKKTVLNVLYHAFYTNSHTLWFLMPFTERNKDKLLRTLLNVCIAEGNLYNGVCVTNNGKGVAIWKHQKARRTSFAEVWTKLVYLIQFGPTRVHRALMSDRYLASHYPKTEFIYLWFIGIHPEYQGLGLSRELLQPYFDLADQRQLPIYLETGEPRNVELYQHLGFTTYHQWHLTDGSNLTVYMMRREAR